MEKWERLARLRNIVRAAGSKARTMRGMIPHICARAEVVAAMRGQRSPKTRGMGQKQWRDRQGQLRLLSRFGQPDLPLMIERYLRWRCGESRALAYSPAIVPGDGLEIAGDWGWRSGSSRYPGEYHASTRHIAVGLGFLAAHCRDLHQRNIGGALTIWEGEPILAAHGYRVYRAAISGRPVSLVVAGDPLCRRVPWAYHCSDRFPESALQAARVARLRQSARGKRIESAQLGRTWVSLEDSLAAGNCLPITEAVRDRAYREIGARGECAVRADVLLSLRDDAYSRRAVAFAIRSHIEWMRRQEEVAS